MYKQDISFLKDKFNTEIFPVYKFLKGNFSGNLNSSEFDYIYKTDINGALEINQYTIDKLNLRIISGRIPTNQNEIVISEFVYRLFEENDLRDYESNKKITIDKYEDLIGKTILLEGNKFIISGIIDTRFNYDRYEILNSKTISDFERRILNNELDSILKYGLHYLVFVCDGFFEGSNRSNK